MSSFSFTTRSEGSTFVCQLMGRMDEFAYFPDLPSCDVLLIQLDRVTALNSIGIRQWCRWISTFPPQLNVKLEGCPVVFVRAFNLVAGTLLPNMKVISFYVPYYSEQNDDRKDVLYSEGKEFNWGKVQSHPQVMSSAGHAMEIDFFGNYFEFLKS
jgi:hypothetical protein